MKGFDQDEARKGKIRPRPEGRKLIRGKFCQVVVYMPVPLLQRLTKYQLTECGGKLNVRTMIILEAPEEFLERKRY